MKGSCGGRTLLFWYEIAREQGQVARLSELDQRRECLPAGEALVALIQPDGVGGLTNGRGNARACQAGVLEKVDGSHGANRSKMFRLVQAFCFACGLFMAMPRCYDSRLTL